MTGNTFETYEAENVLIWNLFFGVVPQSFIASAEHASSRSQRRLPVRPLRKRAGSDGSKLGAAPMRVFPAPAVVLTALAVSRPCVARS